VCRENDRSTDAVESLYLDGVEFFMYDADHPLYLFGCDGAGAALLPQQVHHVGRELLTALYNN
jgi:hypothetical protein